MPVAPVGGPVRHGFVEVDGSASTSAASKTSSTTTTTATATTTASMSRQHSRTGSLVTSSSPGIVSSPRFSRAGLAGSPERPPSPRRTKSYHEQLSDSSSDEGDDTVSLAQLIQARRRQASAPFHSLSPSTSSSSTSSSIARSPGALFGKLAGAGFTSLDNQSEELATNGSGLRKGSRSRPSSRSSTVSGLHLDTLAQRDFTHHGMVMTPTTEEWRSLGGQLMDLQRERERARSKGDEEAVSLSTETSPVLGATHMPRKNSRVSSNKKDPLSLSFDGDDGDGANDTTAKAPSSVSLKHTTSFSFSSNRKPGGGFTHTASSSIDLSTSARSSLDLSLPTASTSAATVTSPQPISPSEQPFEEATPSKHKKEPSESSRPNLSRGSLSLNSTSSKGGIKPLVPATTVTAPTPTRPSLDSAQTGTSIQTDDEKDEVEAVDLPPPPSPVNLMSTFNLGPVDPSKYSAVTGQRSIDDFIVQGEAGKGAYGTVRKAHLKGENGEPVGPELIIKYVIKQRILADCWKKHKILGPIPIEVHVLDHLRRVPYVPRPPKRRRVNETTGRLNQSYRRDSAPSLKEGVVTGHPNICGMLDFFEDGEFYYLIMPQAGMDPLHPDAPKGMDLFDYVDMHPDGLAPDAIRTILYQVTDALYFLHSHNIVHRDIKDENVVLSGDDALHVSLIDFGSAAYVKEGKKFDTFSGTLDFAAPEVLKGARYGGKETDIWALGVLAYVLICGECPFWSPDEAMHGLTAGSRALESLEAKVAVAPPSKNNNHSQQQREMELAVDVVCRCLEVDPNRRPSADDLLDHAFFTASCPVDSDATTATEGGWSGPMGWLTPTTTTSIE